MTETPELGMLDQTEAARSSFSQVTLPTGLLDEEGKLHNSVLLNEMTGEEEDILASNRMTAVQKTSLILENCVQAIGPFGKENEKLKHYIKSLSLNDRLFLLIQIRVISLGESFNFKIACPSCAKSSNQTVTLNDFKVVGLADPYRQTWSGELPRSKKKYECKIQNGYDEDNQKNINEDDILSSIIMTRLKKLDDKNVTMSAVKKLPVADRNHLRAEMKDAEGSIDNKLEINCPHCKFEFESEIDIGNASFFFP